VTLIFCKCSGAFEEWWDILLQLYQKFTAKSVGDIILKIDQHLIKLEAKIWNLFSGHGVDV